MSYNFISSASKVSFWIRSREASLQLTLVGLTTYFPLVDHNQAKSGIMPVSRMRMRPWLEKMIESNSVSGLNWVDKDKTMFSIPWKHAARHGWELDKDACLFKMWALHTGKYVEGQTCDPKTWKANFRCAMNSLPDIQEVKDRSINKGHQAVRVFRMLPITPKSRDKRSKVGKLRHKIKVKLEEESDSDSCQSPVEQPHLSPQDNRVDSTMHTEQQDVTFMNTSEVPDWSFSVEVGPESSFSHRFEVSPAHSTVPDEYNDIIEICEQLERETHWMASSLDGKGVLCNEACTSPGSQWSEASSADDVEEQPQYTTLGPNYALPTDDFWNSFCQGIPSIL